MTQCCPGFQQINHGAPAVLMGTGWRKVQLVGVAKTTGGLSPHLGAAVALGVWGRTQ